MEDGRNGPRFFASLRMTLVKMEVLAQHKICETCGSSVELEMPSGFCPACLLTTALERSQKLAAGSCIEHYELLNEIARGGMGIVYRARQVAPSRVVALKMILPTHLSSLGAVQRFRAEAETAASLEHENILPIYAVGQQGGAPFFSMKFADGGTLSARIDNYRDKPREAAALVAKLARAVAFAHEHGILHRDLKPGNVLFDSAGKAYVSDFGLAKWLQRECDLTQTLAILGTPYYMAPEQATDSRGVTAAADVYSLGAILYHLLAGRPPIWGETPMEVLHRAATEKPKSPRLTNSRVSRDLETICLKCLEKEPGARYVSAAALADDLERFCAGHTIQARPVGPVNRAWRWSRRNPVPASLTATTVVLLIVIAALMPLRRETMEHVPAAKAVAVLPFQNFSDDKENASIAEGIQDEILADLTKVADLKVIGRRSAEQFRGTKQSMREIGRALGVGHVLEGTVRKAGGRIHVATQLVDTRNDTQTWAETYDRDVADLFVIQKDISQEVVSRLKAVLSPEEKAAIEEKPTDDKEAYELYLQARALVYGFWGTAKAQKEDGEKAITLLESAIARDPKFSLAYCVLADAHLDFLDLDPRDKARSEKAKQAIDAALRISPNSAEAHLRKARYLFVAADDVNAAEKELTIAAAGLPGRVDVYSMHAAIEARNARWTEALRDAVKAAELDPRDPEAALGLAGLYVLLRRYNDAQRLIDHMIAAAPEKATGPFWRWKCSIALAKGDAKSALAALESSPYRNAGLYILNHARAYVLVLQRDYTRAEQLLQSIDVTAKPGNAVVDDGDELYRRGLNFERLGRIVWFRRDKEKARGYFEAARQSFEQWLANKPPNEPWSPRKSLALAYIAEIDAALGRTEDAIREGRSAVEYCQAQARRNPLAPIADIQALLAIVYMWSGERDAALQQLAAVAKLQAMQIVQLPAAVGLSAGELKLNPIWDELRDDPRFDKIVEEAKQPVALK
jgi:serine/threonine protein kinase/tetratricopeptide (TPR) repeat protein